MQVVERPVLYFSAWAADLEERCQRFVDDHTQLYTSDGLPCDHEWMGCTCVLERWTLVKAIAPKEADGECEFVWENANKSLTYTEQIPTVFKRDDPNNRGWMIASRLLAGSEVPAPLDAVLHLVGRHTTDLACGMTNWDKWNVKPKRTRKRQ